MKLINIVTIFSIGIITLFMTGCGGEGGSSENTTPSPTLPIYVSGGTLDAPVNLSLDNLNEISSNQLHNFFKYTGIESEKLLIHAILDNELTRSQKISCQMQNSTFISIYDENLNWLDELKTCTKDFEVSLPEDGTYIIQFKYPDNSGYAEASSIRNKSNFVASLPALSLDNVNEISSNQFHNFFKHTGIESEKLLIHVTLDNELTRSQKISCQMQNSTFISIYDENLNWLDELKTCTKDFEVSLPEDGTYIIQFKYPDNSGYAEATAVKP